VGWWWTRWRSISVVLRHFAVGIALFGLHWTRIETVVVVVETSGWIFAFKLASETHVRYVGNYLSRFGLD
jgi:hypothetical protein